LNPGSRIVAAPDWGYDQRQDIFSERAMTDKDLQDKLEQLRAEIDKVAAEDTRARERLDALLGDVEKAIDSESEEEVDDNLVENIRDAISQFETAHPRATAILNDIMVTLSNMGI
jgi:hypothetical protein